MSINREAVLYRTSRNGRKKFYIDKENSQDIANFLNEDQANAEKFNMIIDLLLDHPRVPKDLYDTEQIDNYTKNVYAIKPFKGKKNPRIYCQQYSDKNQHVFVIIAAEYLPKKKSQSNSKKENALIKKVGGYSYDLKNN